jgi:hypothetical protein
MTRGQKVTWTHLVGDTQYRRETWVEKVYKNGNFKVWGCVSPLSLEPCGRLARINNSAKRGVSPHIVVEL